jgi:hypothetical protein
MLLLQLAVATLFSTAAAQGLLCSSSSSLHDALADESVSAIVVPGARLTPRFARTSNIDCCRVQSLLGLRLWEPQPAHHAHCRPIRPLSPLAGRSAALAFLLRAHRSRFVLVQPGYACPWSSSAAAPCAAGRLRLKPSEWPDGGTLIGPGRRVAITSSGEVTKSDDGPAGLARWQGRLHRRGPFSLCC